MLKDIFRSWFALWGYRRDEFFMFGILLIIAILFSSVFVFELLRLIF